MGNFKLKSFDGLELNSYLFEVENPIGVVQIIHGMKEYSERYFDFISFLNTNNFNVFISDLRAHGKTSKSIEELGYTDGDIYKETLQDQLFISKFLKEKYNNLPLYVLGHSFGSFVSQGYILENGKNKYAEKIILSGSSYNNILLFKLAGFLTNLLILFKGKKAPANFIEGLSFGSYAKKFENGNWLTRNEEIYKKYQESEYCGSKFPFSFYKSMFKNTPKQYKNLKKLAFKTPLLILAGDKDPVSNDGKLVLKLAKTYQKAGFKTTSKLYKDYRHEILNEHNKTEVYNNIINFIKL